jgi:hypothetical protein
MCGSGEIWDAARRVVEVSLRREGVVEAGGPVHPSFKAAAFSMKQRVKMRERDGGLKAESLRAGKSIIGR